MTLTLGLSRANPKTIQDKFLVGYQGWFTCAGDGEPVGPGHHGWLHWFDAPIPYGGHPNTDLWPDVSEYSPSELFPAPGLQTKDGEQVFLFSSRHPKTVQRHFHWMALHGVDGAFLQRFAGQCDLETGNHGIRRIRDEVGDRVKEAAEAEGRVFAIMSYDVSGVPPDKIQRVLEQDWIHLLRDQCLLDSPNYLREKGRPVVALWGFGFNDRNHTPDLVRSITAFFRSSTPGGVYLVAGVPGHWRTSTSDADRNPDFVQVWTQAFDAISPWTVGRYGDEDAADRWGEERVKEDAEYLKKLEEEGGKKVDYIPVVLPGGSGYNLSQGKWGLNGIKRNGGRFLWKQIYNARRAGVRTIYGAMWDEYDEGTAFMPVVSSSSQLPVHPSYPFIALDVDGCELPSDWYMRIAGFAAEAFHGERRLMETFPVKELQDYWGSRPHYEEAAVEGGNGGPVEAGHALRPWEAGQGSIGIVDEAPPPPYSEEALHQQEVQQQQTPGKGHTAYPPEKVEIVMTPPAVPPRRPSHSNPASPSVSFLADEFAQQRISAPAPVPAASSVYQPASVAGSGLSPNHPSMPVAMTSPAGIGADQGPWRPPSHSPRPSVSPAPSHPSTTYSPTYISTFPIPSPQPQGEYQSDSNAPLLYHPYQGGWTGGPYGHYGQHVGHSSQPNIVPYPQPQDPYSYPNQTMMPNPSPMGPHGPYGYDGSYSPQYQQASPPVMVPGSMSPPPIPPRMYPIILHVSTCKRKCHY
ncbi:hypothetical protein F5I97DRAFT_1813288 [Phlebopus sp. FC_14]|nr:hypothetical protein F5I97DRAFT_1813288 [Phlebopus sp. FC_14]